MKKLIILFLMSLVSMPVFAVCSITGGACTASSNWESTPLKEKYVPNNLQELQRTDAFRPGYVKPYYSELINTDSQNTSKPPVNEYNSNCQFGVCLPGVEAGPDILE